MSQQVPEQFDNVSVPVKANVYFDGKVVSHTVLFADGSRKTLGVILPGEYHFGTGVPERMDITAGTCRIKLPGQADWQVIQAGTAFDVPGDSAFDIVIDEGVLEYVCSYG